MERPKINTGEGPQMRVVEGPYGWRCSKTCCYSKDCFGFRNERGRCPQWTWTPDRRIFDVTGKEVK